MQHSGEGKGWHGLQVWENLRVLSERYPVEGNHGGSYLTMLSKGGFVFGIINIVGNFGTVYNDQVGFDSPKQMACTFNVSTPDKGIQRMSVCFVGTRYHVQCCMQHQGGHCIGCTCYKSRCIFSASLPAACTSESA